MDKGEWKKLYFIDLVPESYLKSVFHDDPYLLQNIRKLFIKGITEEEQCLRMASDLILLGFFKDDSVKGIAFGVCDPFYKQLDIKVFHIEEELWKREKKSVMEKLKESLKPFYTRNRLKGVTFSTSYAKTFSQLFDQKKSYLVTTVL